MILAIIQMIQKRSFSSVELVMAGADIAELNDDIQLNQSGAEWCE